MDTGSEEIIKSVKLEYPVKLKNGDEIKVIDFIRRPVAGDLRGMDLNNLKMEEQCKILASITSIASPAVLFRVDMADMSKLSEILVGFLEGGQETETT